uniref:NADPH-dependent assimilatory sulfite reductase hemoprotein subunit n=1 Tax=Acidicaldus sp. TaxID=1872105 RepID=A0A8J4HEK6_9PROT
MTLSLPPSGIERLKQASRFLRGDIAADLAAPGAEVSEASYNLLKFHGTYEQHDRDTATARKQRGEAKEFSFMVRVRMPGGMLTPAQYLALDALADDYANGTLRITTRQGVQFHGVIKGDLKPAIAAINRALLTTSAACGDVVRNITTTPAPRQDAIHRRLRSDARRLSEALLPASRAYHELFLDAAAQAELGAAPEAEPLYGPTYLPRKFKIGLAAPADNAIDVLTNDLGIIALHAGERLLGYNLALGGGLGMTHNKPATYPRLATPLACIAPDDLLRGVEAVIALQRDWGNRADRRRARLKYLLDDRGPAWVREKLAFYFGAPLAPPHPMPRLEVPEILGWHAQGDGRFWLGVPVPSGRIEDRPGCALRTALRDVIARFAAAPIMTPQQDILLADLAPDQRAPVEAVLRAHGVALAEDLTPLARWALACPALPTCGLALAEAERVRAPIVAAIAAALARYDLADERISLRITGCPNGCARPYAGDIGIVGRMPGHYALYVGGDFAGTRLSFKLLDKVAEADLAATLAPLFAAFAQTRQAGEGFGDFCNRLGADALLALGRASRAA